MTAPKTRVVDQFTGNVAERPSAFFRALSEADSLCAELDGVRELRCRIEELEAENRELRTRLARAEQARDTAQAMAAAR